MPPGTEEAWNFARSFAQALARAQLPGYRATYLIGSLAAGYFEPGSSDIDLVALFAGERPPEAQFQALRAQLAALVKEAAHKFPGLEMECLPRFEGELLRDAQGRLPNPDLAARLLLQSVCLDTQAYPLKVDAPVAADFKAELNKHLLSQKQMTQGLETKAAPRKLINHALTLMRYCLAIQTGALIYDKNEIIPAFLRAGSPVKVPAAVLEHAGAVRKGAALDAAQLAALSKAVRQFEKQMIEYLESTDHPSA